MPAIPACRGVLGEIQSGDHAGLLLDFYLRQAGDEGAARRDLFAAAISATRSAAGIYRPAFDRWLREVQPQAQRNVQVAGRLVVGLGAGSTLETGLTLHHVYGVPLIPGSALKGLASSYCHTEWGERDPLYRSESESGAHRVLFGTNDHSGCIVFHDAWILPESLEDGGGLALDVMTPHHSKYYMTGGRNAAADTDDPNPVTFLSVTGRFRLALSCTAGTLAEQSQWAELAMELLLQATAEWGAGGKTSSGYGRMS